MCGSSLAQFESSLLIDDDDPLEIDLREPIKFREKDRRREFARTNAPPSDGSRGTTPSAAIANLPPDTVEEDAEKDVRNRKSANREITGIGGPSFLGLGYENSNSGFVYDDPRDDGFVYDSDAPPPEYLLEEVPRGVSWRAWALFLLLLIGAGLGYVQWRASHHQGFPDIASILARNGPTVDPSGPDMRNNNSARKAQPPASDSSSADRAKNGDTAKSEDGSATSTDAAPAKASANSEESSAAKDSTDAKSTNAADKDKKMDASPAANKKTEDAEDAASTSKSPKASAAAASASDKDSDESAKPESDGPVGNVTKSKRVRPAPVEEEKVSKPKSLGEKDPLIVRANKYLQGRGAGKNCSAAVNLLRQASSAGNPSADVKMGALYWSGTCVTQSNVTAYQWFARAHSEEPNNRWIERSRSSLWARLTPAEKRRVGY